MRFCEVLKPWHFHIWKDTKLRGSKLGTNVGVVFGSLNPSAHWVEKCDHSSFKKDSWRLILLWLSKFSSWHEADLLLKIYIGNWIYRWKRTEFVKMNWNCWKIWYTGQQLLSHQTTNSIYYIICIVFVNLFFVVNENQNSKFKFSSWK